jgi:hypothetical protein
MGAPKARRLCVMDQSCEDTLLTSGHRSVIQFNDPPACFVPKDSMAKAA